MGELIYEAQSAGNKSNKKDTPYTYCSLKSYEYSKIKVIKMCRRKSEEISLMKVWVGGSEIVNPPAGLLAQMAARAMLQGLRLQAGYLWDCSLRWLCEQCCRD